MQENCVALELISSVGWLITRNLDAFSYPEGFPETVAPG